MDKKEEFKNFARMHPELIKIVKNKESTWQDLFEIYDVYGEDNNAWNKFLDNDNTIKDSSKKTSIDELTKLVKGVNIDNVQKYINNAQKAINVIKELTTKGETIAPSIIPKTTRPITKFFGD